MEHLTYVEQLSNITYDSIRFEDRRLEKGLHSSTSPAEPILSYLDIYAVIQGKGARSAVWGDSIRCSFPLAPS